ncbi:helix-turn-helix domain-containing protein [Streptomyces sp. NPDC102274]|uniref:helix-turn-helix domain-containing protein n=1 Tax=Streptomyces sp. NPDC102274 TaxID=3366151 RepID=UPI003800EB74
MTDRTTDGTTGGTTPRTTGRTTDGAPEDDFRPGDPVPHRADLGRRVVARRRELGLTREDVAVRAGSAPGYIQYLEEHSAAPGTGFLLRLADALETSVPELTGATTDLPPGIGAAGYHPELITLNSAESWALLSTHGVGRVAVTRNGEPAIFPVNYTVDGDLVAFRTAPDAAPAAAAGHEIAFEVDHIDDAFSQGWSVLVVGMAQPVTDPDRVLRLEELAHTTAWAGGDRGLWIAVSPTQVTGRRIQVRHRHRPSV